MGFPKKANNASITGEVLSEDQLQRLARHKYSANGVSAVEPYLQPFWRWLVEQIPLWWAPNALTLAGLVINGLTTIILMAYSPDGLQEAPIWCYYSCALGLFIYQTLDAIDGKQARRTNSSSPLGELFDHGCDALSIVFVVLGSCVTIQFGTNPILFFLECFSTMFLYYMAHWQTFCSGTLQFGFFDVTEAQIGIIFAYAITGYLGPSIWTVEIIPSTGLQMKLIPSGISFIAGLVAMYNYFKSIFMRGGVGKNGSTVAGTSVLSPAFPIGILMASGIYIWLNSPTNVFEHHPVLFAMTFGLAASKLSNKLVISHMSRSKMEMFDTSLFGPLLFVISQYFQLVDDYIALCFCFVYCSFDLLRFAVNVCCAICDHLNIHCFSIKPVLSSTASASTKNGSSHSQHSEDHHSGH